MITRLKYLRLRTNSFQYPNEGPKKINVIHKRMLYK